MHIDIVPNRGSPPAVLLRESYREGEKVKKRTLANLSALSADQVEAIRLILKGQRLAPVDELFERVESFHHGHVQAVRSAMQRLGFSDLVASRPSRERDLVCAMVASQILEPDSKLGFTRWWQNTTLPEIFGARETNEDELYAAMDWLLERQPHIEKKLAARHLAEGGLALYDLSSSYFEGVTCPLAALGHNRDGKKGKLQVNYGLLTDSRGCPVTVSVFKGNTSDPKTLMPQIEKAKTEYGIERLVLVGDRGMIGQKQIKQCKDHAGIGWITALKTGAIRKLLDGGQIQMDLFDERNLFELTHPDYPGERLVACRNPELAKLRAHKRQSLLDATTREIQKVSRMVENGRLEGRAQIGVRLGRVINKYKVAKHFKLDIGERSLSWNLQEENIAAEAALDGIYVIRTSLKKTQMDADTAVRSYKQLSNVERAFRSMKTMDLEIRPIRHHLEERVRAHIFLCMLAYYVKWHMNEAWRPLLFCDEQLEAKKARDPVAPAVRSEAALEKVHTKQLEDGSPAHSFQTLIARLSAIVRNVCHAPGTKARGPTFEIVTTPDKTQQAALSLLEKMVV
jgi:transposase